MIVREGREPYLDRVLSVVEASFDGKVIVPDDGSVQLRDYADQRNRVIKTAEDQGFDWMFMLDADECMYPSDIESVKRFMPTDTLIMLPRIELVRDFDHFDPILYPDVQVRVFKLGMGYHYRGCLHEALYAGDAGTESFWSPKPRPAAGVLSPATPIYHYGRTKSLDETLLRYYNYDLISRGRAPIGTLPERAAVTPEWWNRARPFPAMHPLRDSEPSNV
jgi:hypothetical protein